VLGSGKSIAVGANTSKVNTNVSLSYTDPYYTVDGVSRGFDTYFRRSDPRGLSLGNYRTQSVGGGVRYGYPISDLQRLSFGLSIDQTNLELFSTSPASVIAFAARNGESYTSLLATGGWTNDSRDSVIWPTSGLLQRANAEVSVPPGSLRYYKTTFQNQIFLPLTPSLTLMLNGEIGGGDGYGGKELPFFRNYYAGGTGTVRGFDPNSLGPRDINDIPTGGNRRIIGNMELLFPMPGMGRDRSMRLSAFLDAGQVFAKSQKLAFDDLRYSAGMGFLWNSPFGPMRLNFGNPLNKKENDKVQRVQFQLGQVF
jgi:outer membrane protein insertion porin family